MNHEDELKLIEDLKEGKEIALSKFVSEYHTALMNLAIYQYKIPRAEADPLVNKTFFKAWRSISKFKSTGHGSFLKWMMEILRNNIIDYTRKTKEEQKKMRLSSYDESVIEEYDSNLSTLSILREVELKNINLFLGENFRQDERIDIIISVMNTFSDDHQADLWSYFYGYSHKEIASMRKCTVESSRKHINRLIQKFAKKVCAERKLDWRPIYENLKR